MLFVALTPATESAGSARHLLPQLAFSTARKNSPLMASFLHAQTVVSPKPKFEVVSIKKRSEPVFTPANNRNFGGMFVRESTALGRMILYAYGLSDYQLVGGPSWVRSPVLFEVAASAGKDVPEAELRLMVQSMLEDRFKLATHYEKREMPVYDLVLARSDGRLGDGLTRIIDDDCTKPTSGSSVRRAGASAMWCGRIAGIVNVARGLMRAPVTEITIDGSVRLQADHRGNAHCSVSSRDPDGGGLFPITETIDGTDRRWPSYRSRAASSSPCR